MQQVDKKSLLGHHFNESVIDLEENTLSYNRDSDILHNFVKLPQK